MGSNCLVLYRSQYLLGKISENDNKANIPQHAKSSRLGKVSVMLFLSHQTVFGFCIYNILLRWSLISRYNKEQRKLIYERKEATTLKSIKEGKIYLYSCHIKIQQEWTNEAVQLTREYTRLRQKWKMNHSARTLLCDFIWNKNKTLQ